MKRIPVFLFIVAATLVAPAPEAAALSASEVETQILDLVNSGRQSKGKAPLVYHSGLRAQARSHAAYMDTENGLSHDNASSRFNKAAPVPTEANGAPDDGFNGWCENVGFTMGYPDDQVPGQIHQGWVNSTPHRKCMYDENTSRNVGAVGAFHDNGNDEWWITLMIARDDTPPGSSPATPPPTSPPTPPPTAPPATDPPVTTDPPTGTEEPTPEVSPTATAAPDPTTGELPTPFDSALDDTGGDPGMRASAALGALAAMLVLIAGALLVFFGLRRRQTG